MVQISELPHLDEHTTIIAADADEVWPVLLRGVEEAFSRAGSAIYARAVGCANSSASGRRPLAEGSTIPGFRVVSVIPDHELKLEGRHRFSSYALIFRIEQTGRGRTMLRAQSRAEFPGLAGGLYRLLVVRSGGHVVAVRRMLSVIKRRSEHRAGR